MNTALILPGHYVMLTRDDEMYSCALSDESVRYGTDNYELFRQAIEKDFTPKEAEQILSCETSIVEGLPSYIPFDSTIPYFVDESKSQKKILHVNAYPKEEYEGTKKYKSRRPVKEIS